MLYETFSIISVLQTYMSQYVYNNKPDLKEMLKASVLYIGNLQKETSAFRYFIS